MTGFLFLMLTGLANANADAATDSAKAWDKAHCAYFNPGDAAACNEPWGWVECQPSLREHVDCTWAAGHSPVRLACGGLFGKSECTEAD